MPEPTRHPLRILLTNNTLASHAGSELYIRDLSIELMKRGHFPIAYSSVLGAVAQELRVATIPVIDNLGDLGEAPDIIHGQHHLDAMAAMLRFPKTPALYVCHGWAPWEEHPPLFPSVRRYVAIDDLCRERLLNTRGITAQEVEVLYNFVDLNRFRRRFALPAKPRRALVFSNYAMEGLALASIQGGCRRFGIEEIDVVGVNSGNAVDRPEAILASYDIVFAKARCALEAMAVGCAVIVADFTGLGGMVTTGNMANLRRLNFGVRTMQKTPVSEEGILAELQQYDPNNARQVSRWIRQQADLQKAVDHWERIYQDVIFPKEGPSPGLSPDDMLAAAADYLCSLHLPLKTLRQAETEGEKAHIEKIQAYAQVTELQKQQQAWQQERVAQESAYKELQSLHEQGQRALEHCQQERSNLANDLHDQEFLLAQERTAFQGRQQELASVMQQQQAELCEIHNSRAWAAIKLYRKLRGCLQRR